MGDCSQPASQMVKLAGIGGIGPDAGAIGWFGVIDIFHPHVAGMGRFIFEVFAAGAVISLIWVESAPGRDSGVIGSDANGGLSAQCVILIENNVVAPLLAVRVLTEAQIAVGVVFELSLVIPNSKTTGPKNKKRNASNYYSKNSTGETNNSYNSIIEFSFIS